MENLLHQILQEIQEIKKAQQNMRTELTDIKTEQHNIRTELTDIKTEQHNMRTELTDIKTEQQNMRTELTDIKTEQHNMRTELTDIKTEQHNMRTELTDIKTEQTNSKQKIQNINESIDIGFAHLNNRMDRLEGRIESEIIDKIRGLYDARELIIDNLSEFREEFNDTMEEIIKRDFDKTVKLNKIEKIINLKNVK